VATRRSRTAQILAVQSGQNIRLRDLVALAKQRWIIERDYQELKQELGLGHFEGRGWRGFHHHAPSRSSLWLPGGGAVPFFPSARNGHLGLPAPELPPGFQPAARIRPERHNPHSIATLRIVLSALCFASYATVRSVAFNVYKQ